MRKKLLFPKILTIAFVAAVVFFAVTDIHAVNHRVRINSTSGNSARVLINTSIQSEMIYYVIQGTRANAYSYLASSGNLISDRNDKITNLANMNQKVNWGRLVQMGTKRIPKGNSYMYVHNLKANTKYTMMVYTYTNSTSRSKNYKGIFSFTEFTTKRTNSSAVSVTAAQSKRLTAYGKTSSSVTMKYKSTISNSVIMAMIMNYQANYSQMVVYRGNKTNLMTYFNGLPTKQGYLASVAEYSATNPSVASTLNLNTTFYTGIKLNVTAKTVYKGRSYNLIPQYNLSANELKWSSANSRIASVSQAGKVTGVGVGRTTVTAKSPDGVFSVKCIIAVKNLASIPAKGITLSHKTAMLPSGSFIIKPTLIPSNSTDKITWTSSNPRAATVTSSGGVRKVAKGTTRIIAKTTSGKTATCVVTVK